MSRPIDHGEARAAIGRAAFEGIDQILTQEVHPRTTKVTEPFGWTTARGAIVVFDTRGPVEPVTFWGRHTQRTAVEAVGTTTQREFQAPNVEPHTTVRIGGSAMVVNEFSSTDQPGKIIHMESTVSPLKNGLVVVEFSPTDRPEEQRVLTVSVAGDVRRYKKRGEERRPIQSDNDPETQLNLDLLDTSYMLRAVNEHNPGADVEEREISEWLEHRGISADEFFA